MNLADFKHQREIQDILRATNPMQKILGREKASDLLVPESRLVLVHPCSFVQDAVQGIVLPVDYSRHQQAMLSSALVGQPGGGGGAMAAMMAGTTHSGSGREDHNTARLSGEGGGDAAERLLMSRQSSATLVSVATLNDALEPHEILLEKTILNTRSRRHQRQLKMMLSQEVARSRQRLLLCRSGVLDPYGHQQALERLREASTPQQPLQLLEDAPDGADGGRTLPRQRSTLGEAIGDAQRRREAVDSPHFSSEEGSDVEDEGGTNNANDDSGYDLLTSHLASLRSTTGRITGHHGQSFFFTDLPENDDDACSGGMNGSTLEPRAMKLSVRLAGASSSIPLSLLSKDSQVSPGSGKKQQQRGFSKRRTSFLHGGDVTHAGDHHHGGDVSMYHNPFRAPAAGSEEETLQRKQSRRSTGSFRRQNSTLVPNGSFTLVLRQTEGGGGGGMAERSSVAASPTGQRKRNPNSMFGADVPDGDDCVHHHRSSSHNQQQHRHTTRNLSITTNVTVSPDSSRATSPTVSPNNNRRRRSTKSAVVVEPSPVAPMTVVGSSEWTPSTSLVASESREVLEDYYNARRQDPLLSGETPPTGSASQQQQQHGRTRTASPQAHGAKSAHPSSPLKQGGVELTHEEIQRGLLEKQRELFFKFPDFKASAVLAKDDEFVPPTADPATAIFDVHKKKEGNTQQQRLRNHNKMSSSERSPVRGGAPSLSPPAQHLLATPQGATGANKHRLGPVAQRRQPQEKPNSTQQQQQQQQPSKHQLSQQQHLHEQIQQQRHAAMAKLVRSVRSIRLEPLASGQKHQHIMKASHETTDSLSANSLEKLERRVREQPAKYAKKFAALDLNGRLPFHASASAVLEHVEHLILQQERESSRRDAHDKVSARLDEISQYCLGRFQHPAARTMVHKTLRLVVDDDVIPSSDMFTTRLLHDCPPHMFLLDELTTVAVHLAEIYGLTRADAIKTIRHYARAFVIDRRDGVASRLGGGGGGVVAGRWSDDDMDDDYD